MVPRPTLDRLVIRRDPREEVSEGGVFIPDVAQRPSRTGEVLAVGEEVAATVTPGDVVVYGAYAGTELTVGEETYLLLDERDVLAVLEETP